MKMKPVSSKMGGMAKATKGMGKASMPKFGKGKCDYAPKRHVMNKLKR